MKFIGDCGLKTEKKFEKTYIILPVSFYQKIFMLKILKKKRMKFIGDCGLKTEKKFEKTYIRQ